MLCGDESEDEEEDVGFWWDRCIEGTPILDPERIVDPHVLSLITEEVPLTLASCPGSLRLPRPSRAPSLQIVPGSPQEACPQWVQRTSLLACSGASTVKVVHTSTDEAAHRSTTEATQMCTSEEAVYPRAKAVHMSTNEEAVYPREKAVHSSPDEDAVHSCSEAEHASNSEEAVNP